MNELLSCMSTIMKLNVYHISASLPSRQESASVSANDIIIISIVDVTGGLQVTFFVRVMSGVVSVQAIADAVQVNNYR